MTSLDFMRIATKEQSPQQGGGTTLYPSFVVRPSKDLMVKGNSFFAIWDEERGVWSTDSYDVPRLVDGVLYAEAEKYDSATVSGLQSFDNGRWTKFQQYVKTLGDNWKQLDERVIFADQPICKEDYATKRLSYSCAEGSHDAWDELVNTLYRPNEVDKIEWAIGAVVAGEAKTIQKFFAFYGKPGSGKSTIIGIIQDMFEGYSGVFNARALGTASAQFALEAFKSNPLIAVDHDVDMNNINDNTKINAIVSHEPMLVNEKHKSAYAMKFNSTLIVGTNNPIRISDAKSGLIRRLIVITSSGDTVEALRYRHLMEQVKFEYGAIAYHCLQKFKKMTRHYYDNYKPISMMYITNPIMSFVNEVQDEFIEEQYITLTQAYTMYKEWCKEVGIEYPERRQVFQAELQNYFEEFYPRKRLNNGLRLRSVYSGFKPDMLLEGELGTPEGYEEEPEETDIWSCRESIFDAEYAGMPAQLANAEGTPSKRWVDVDTVLGTINTHELHYVKVPQNHIVIDFDLRDDNGNKSLSRNLEAIKAFPPTYGEVSKSGAGVHLHYIYDGDVDTLAPLYSEGIEVKVYKGNSSLRRKFTVCNGMPIAHISGGLPLKETKMLSTKQIQTERGLRDLIERNLRKEIHPSTKSSVDFIKKILDDAYSSGLVYNVEDMKPVLLGFAAKSTNNALYCLKEVKTMQLKGKEAPQQHIEIEDNPKKGQLVFFDVEVYPNLFVVCYKHEGSNAVIPMLNPTPKEIEGLLKHQLVGFNNRRYDNHILYARLMGYSNQELFELSSRIINDRDRDSMFIEAYGLSYADIYDFSSKKQSLKKFEFDLGIKHMEMEIPWDKEVGVGLWPRVIEYCSNDVRATEAVFHDRKADYEARLLLSELSGLPVNDVTRKHVAKIIFGDEKNPQDEFVYTDLSEMFPGYSYDAGVSTYRGETTGEGGYVYAEPGIYDDVALLDVASMHPTSIEELNLFGPYTEVFSQIKRARLAIKHGDLDAARSMLGGKLRPFLEGGKDELDNLSYSLKIIINSVYGLTSAKFDNPFRDIRNVDNIVAKRGALFMIDLKHFVQEQGFTVAHIKTDSIKIPNATPEIIQAVTEFGKKYGYEFEHEDTYKRMCLVNDAVYVAYSTAKEKWTATGAQFQHPVVFKTMFSGEPVTLDDYKEQRSVTKGVIWLGDSPEMDNSWWHVGRTASLVPVIQGGKNAYRVTTDNGFKAHSVAGTKGWLWKESSQVESLDEVDTTYADHLVEAAIDQIERFGTFKDFVTL